MSNPVYIPDDNVDVAQQELTEVDKQMVEFIDWTDPIGWRSNGSHNILLKQWKRIALCAGFAINDYLTDTDMFKCNDGVTRAKTELDAISTLLNPDGTRTANPKIWLVKLAHRLPSSSLESGSPGHASAVGSRQ